jgi:hypothetical protein
VIELFTCSIKGLKVETYVADLRYISRKIIEV